VKEKETSSPIQGDNQGDNEYSPMRQQDEFWQLALLTSQIAKIQRLEEMTARGDDVGWQRWLLAETAPGKDGSWLLQGLISDEAK
jgi:hypothetical protein